MMEYIGKRNGNEEQGDAAENSAPYKPSKPGWILDFGDLVGFVRELASDACFNPVE